MSKSKKSNDPDLSPLYVICATGEDKVFQYLKEINRSAHPFQLLQLPIHTGDILIGYRHPNGARGSTVARGSAVAPAPPSSTATYQITPSQEENLGANNLAIHPELREVQPLYLIERKTIQDFCQSYRSQHYQNQKTRMLSFRDQNPPCQCILVVEGYHQTSPSKFTRNFPKSTCESCFVSVRLRDHFYVKHVPNECGHAEFIEKCLRTIIRHQLIPDPVTTSNSTGHTMTHLNLAQDYQQTVAVKKKTNMTPELCYKVQLTTIPGISMNMADIIQSHHPNLTTLLEYLKTEGPLALAQISLGKQKLGPAKSKRIHEYLVPPIGTQQTSLRQSAPKMTLNLTSK